MSQSEQNTEITLTQIFKANDIVAESDMLLRFEIRELIRRADGVSKADKWLILRDEARLLKNDTLGFDEKSTKI